MSSVDAAPVTGAAAVRVAEAIYAAVRRRWQRWHADPASTLYVFILRCRRERAATRCGEEKLGRWCRREKRTKQAGFAATASGAAARKRLRAK